MTAAPPGTPPLAAPPAATARRGAGAIVPLLPGLALCAALAFAAVWLAELPWTKQTLHVSPLLLVILLGMLLRIVAALPAAFTPGVRMAQRPVLRWAVAGLGFNLTLARLWAIGAPALVVVTVSTFTALGFGWWIARRLGVPEKLGLLLGVGGAICGASAVVAADSVVQSEHQDPPVALGVITLLGTIGILVYPLLGHALGMSARLFGLWDGGSLHEMAQVVAAGDSVSREAREIATTAKLARISLLAPVVLGLGWWLRRRAARAAAGGATSGVGTAHVAPVPWFLAVFVGFAALNSLAWIPPRVLASAVFVDRWLLCVGMAGVGLVTGFGELRAAGWKPILAATLQWVFLSALAFALARAIAG